MPLGIQAKILRVLQERSFERIGGNDTINVDVRVLAATNRDLEKAMADGRLREDLYHRLNVVTIHIPPLRERTEDIPKLAQYFLDRYAAQLGVEKPPLSKDALEALRTYGWPGNVRELEHCMHRATIFTRGYPIQSEDVQRALERLGEEAPATPESGESDRLQDIVRTHLKSHKGPSPHSELLKTVDQMLVAEALRMSGGNQTHAARLLGLSRPTLQAKMKKYDIRRHQDVGQG
jgi:DNA-binding NtrC family response regulator